MFFIKLFKFIVKQLKAPLGVGVILFPFLSFAQTSTVATARLDARQIMVGDQARLFLEVQNNPTLGALQWATIPDTFNNLEVVERGKIDTIKNGDVVTYRQRLLITGFDSGLFKVPSFVFSVIPGSGTAFTVQSDSFQLLVQTVAVDTTKGFKGIKGIIYVNSSWKDYIWYIVGGVVILALIIFAVWYYLRKKMAAKPVPKGPQESLQDYTLRLLSALDSKQLWQKKQVKEYYVELTDIVRNYIEQRFNTQALELTTEEILNKVQLVKDLQPHYDILFQILQTGDLAKFAKFQPLPHEHIDAMDKAKEFINTSRPVIINATNVDPVSGTSNPTA